MRIVWLALGLIGCGAPVGEPLGQVVLYVDTDAPLGPQSPGIADPIPLFDRVRFDAYAPGATEPCGACVNEFGVDTAAMREGRVSIGLLPKPNVAGYRARVRLYRAAFATSGEPDPNTTIDVTVALPVVHEDGIVAATVDLSVDTIGVPAGVDEPVAPRLGKPGASRVGTWPGAQRVPCEGDPGPDEACAPGGAFWMGETTDALTKGSLSGWRRLVVVSPFFVKKNEVTVLEMRTAAVALPTPWSGGATGAGEDDWCNYTPTPGKRDVLPVNCLTWGESRSYCKKYGGDLPTEAQQEYLMGGLRNQRFAWGSDAPSCADAIWGRNGFGQYKNDEPIICRASSNFLAPLGGPEPPGSGARDKVEIIGGTLNDIAGNMGEWSRDNFQQRSQSCWSGSGVFVDPFCELAEDSHTFREGSWHTGAFAFLPEDRVVAPRPGLVFADVGFRCVRPGL